MEETDVVFLWGSNARDAHPIFFHHVLKGARGGARLYVVDPRRTATAAWADVWLGIRVGSDIATASGRRALVLSAISEGRARGLGQMPAQLYQGREAEEVADFVAAVAGH